MLSRKLQERVLIQALYVATLSRQNALPCAFFELRGELSFVFPVGFFAEFGGEKTFDCFYRLTGNR